MKFLSYKTLILGQDNGNGTSSVTVFGREGLTIEILERGEDVPRFKVEPGRRM